MIGRLYGKPLRKVSAITVVVSGAEMTLPVVKRRGHLVATRLDKKRVWFDTTHENVRAHY